MAQISGLLNMFRKTAYFGLLLLLISSTLSAEPKTELYTVRPGDTLSHLAEQRLGDGSKWRTLWALNPELTQTDLIRVGQQIKLPIRQESTPPRPSTILAPKSAQRVEGGLLDGQVELVRDALRTGDYLSFLGTYDLIDDTQLQTLRATHPQSREQHSSAELHLYQREQSLTSRGQHLHEIRRLGQLAAFEHDGRLKLPLGTAPEHELVIKPLAHHATPSQLIGAIEAPQDISMRVLRTFYNHPSGLYVMLDGGKKQGISEGRIALLYKDGAKPRDYYALNQHTAQPQGTFVVIRSYDQASLALVVSTYNPPAPGDQVR